MLIKGSINAVNVGARLFDQAGTTMRKVAANVQLVNDSPAAILYADHEHNVGIAQINDAVLQIDQITHENAAPAEQAYTTAVKERSRQLPQVVAVFRLGDDMAAPGDKIGCGRVAHLKTPPNTCLTSSDAVAVVGNLSEPISLCLRQTPTIRVGARWWATVRNAVTHTCASRHGDSGGARPSGPGAGYDDLLGQQCAAC